MAQIFHLLAILALASLCEGYHILVVYPFPSKSHTILGDGLVKPLLNAGHEVTYVTSYPTKNPPPKLHQVDISASKAALPADNLLNLTAILNKEMSTDGFSQLFRVISDIVNMNFENPNIQRLINDDKQKFDAVIVEWMFTEIYAGFATIFECPLIWMTTVEPSSISLRLIDEELHPAYHPSPVSRNTPPFSFIQRAQELANSLLFNVARYFLLHNKSVEQYQKYFGPVMAKKGKPLPDYNDVIFNASLMLGNSHVSTGRAIRLPQSYKPIGGYHVDTEVKPLPEDLAKIMDNAKDGVIYFSLGSNLKSKALPDQIKFDLLKMFGSLKYTVLWKFEATFEKVPKNVHILNWAPQQSILAHPNCKLFITHGGLLSTIETVHHGVPIVGIPVFADQPMNVDRAVANGFAMRVDLSYDIAKDLKAAIDEILGYPKYTETIKQLSQVYHDRPVPPARELVHWVEHVVRTRGAPHLRSAALLVPWYQKMYLDLLAAILAAYYLLKIVVKRMCCRSKQQESSKKAKSSNKKKN